MSQKSRYKAISVFSIDNLNTLLKTYEKNGYVPHGQLRVTTISGVNYKEDKINYTQMMRIEIK